MVRFENVPSEPSARVTSCAASALCPRNDPVPVRKLTRNWQVTQGAALGNGIECYSPKAEATGSNPVGCASFLQRKQAFSKSDNGAPFSGF